MDEGSRVRRALYLSRSPQCLVPRLAVGLSGRIGESSPANSLSEQNSLISAEI
jgi:hypothetical protein